MRRVLLKLSGEALAGSAGFGVDPGVVARLCRDIAAARDAGTQVGLVVGGGNLFRGAALQAAGLGRVTGDQMGMLATVMNGLAFRDLLKPGQRALVPACGEGRDAVFLAECGLDVTAAINNKAPGRMQ